MRPARQCILFVVGGRSRQKQAPRKLDTACIWVGPVGGMMRGSLCPPEVPAEEKKRALGGGRLLSCHVCAKKHHHPSSASATLVGDSLQQYSQ